MTKFKPGDIVIYMNTPIPVEVTIAVVEPKKWWHIQQRYLVSLSFPGSFYRYKEKHLLLKEAL